MVDLTISDNEPAIQTPGQPQDTRVAISRRRPLVFDLTAVKGTAMSGAYLRSQLVDVYVSVYLLLEAP